MASAANAPPAASWIGVPPAAPEPMNAPTIASAVPMATATWRMRSEKMAASSGNPSRCRIPDRFDECFRGEDCRQLPVQLVAMRNVGGHNLSKIGTNLVLTLDEPLEVWITHHSSPRRIRLRKKKITVASYSSRVWMTDRSAATFEV